KIGMGVGVVAWLATGPIFGWEYGLRSSLALGALAGLTSGELDPNERILPNQGIWRSARNALSGLLIGLLLATISWVVYLPQTSPQMFFAQAIFVGLLWGFRGGLIACLQHATLRILFLHNEVIPRNYVQFLDDAADRIFLRKMGGGYIFIHR